MIFHDIPIKHLHLVQGFPGDDVLLAQNEAKGCIGLLSNIVTLRAPEPVFFCCSWKLMIYPLVISPFLIGKSSCLSSINEPFSIAMITRGKILQRQIK